MTPGSSPRISTPPRSTQQRKDSNAETLSVKSEQESSTTLQPSLRKEEVSTKTSEKKTLSKLPTTAPTQQLKPRKRRAMMLPDTNPFADSLSGLRAAPLSESLARKTGGDELRRSSENELEEGHRLDLEEVKSLPTKQQDTEMTGRQRNGSGSSTELINDDVDASDNADEDMALFEKLMAEDPRHRLKMRTMDLLKQADRKQGGRQLKPEISRLVPTYQAGSKVTEMERRQVEHANQQLAQLQERLNALPDL